jgi:hypothetical protein
MNKYCDYYLLKFIFLFFILLCFICYLFGFVLFLKSQPVGLLKIVVGISPCSMDFRLDQLGGANFPLERFIPAL